MQLTDINELENLDGEIVSVEGTLLDTYITDNNELICTLYCSKKTVDVIVENNKIIDNDLKINSKISVAGKVQKNYRNEYDIVVTDSKNLKSVGQSDPPEIDWENIDFYNNSYIQTYGTVIGIEDYYGNNQKILIKNTSTKIEGILETTPFDIKIGSNIKVCGILKLSNYGNRIYIYNPLAVEVMGSWNIETHNLDDLVSEPEKFIDYPVYLQGFVKYEPYSNPAFSFNLAEQKENSRFNIWVDLKEVQKEVELHKGDSVSLLANTAYDESSMKYYLVPKTIEVIESHGGWNKDLLDIVENSYEYERAGLNLTGYLLKDENEYYLCDRSNIENTSIKLQLKIINWERIDDYLIENKILSDDQNDLVNASHFKALGEKNTLRGKLTFCPELFIYVFSLEPNPNCVFFNPYI
jgi:hypothetical protein